MMLQAEHSFSFFLFVHVVNFSKHLHCKEMSIILQMCACIIVRVCVSSPDEVPAVGAVGGLSQVGGHELVSINLVDSPADGTLALPGTHPLPKHTLLILGGARRSCKIQKNVYNIIHISSQGDRKSMRVVANVCNVAGISSF